MGVGKGHTGGRPGGGGRRVRAGGGDVSVSPVRMTWSSLGMSESGSSRSIDWPGFRELIEPPSVPASPRSFSASLDIGTPVTSGSKLNSVPLLVLKESVDITLRKVLLSVKSFGLSASTPTLFFLVIDLDLVEGGSVGILQAVACVGERLRDRDIGAPVADRGAFFDFAGQKGRDTKERSGLVVGWGRDATTAELTEVEEADGGT